MRIACPQCSMQYALDPRLLPAGGVPVQCTRCSHVFTAAPPAQATSQATQVFGGPVPAVAPLVPRAKPANPLNSTVIYGAGNKSGAAPSATATQVFGAVPQVAPGARPAANRPQAAQAGAQPSAMTTQVFGAVPQVPPSARQVAPQPPLVGVAATTTIELPDEVPAPRPRSGSFGPSQLAGLENAPRPRSGSFGPNQLAGLENPPRPRSGAIGPSQLAGLEEAPRPRSGAFGPNQLADIMAEEESTQGLSPLSGSSLSSPSRAEPSLSGPPLPGPSSVLSRPLELPPELLEEPLANDNARGRGARSEGGLSSRVLLIAAGVLVLGLTAFLTSPAWLGKSNAVPQEAVVARDSALVVLRRDDTASKVEALSSLKALANAHPQSIELLAEWGTALALHLDDTHVEAATLKAKVERLKSRSSALAEARAPADWPSRVNAMREERAIAERELTPLEERGAALSKEAVLVLKRLAAAPEKEEKEVALARLRARALLSAVLGAGESLVQAVQLAQAGQRDWSELVVAEYVLNGTAPAAQATESLSALARLREANSSFLRTYVLGARISVLRGELDSAQGLLEAVITLNPKHELAQKLQAHVRELALEGPRVSTPSP